MGKVILRSNLTSGSIPQPSDLEVSELVLGGVDGRLWTKTPGNQVMLLNPGGAVAVVTAVSSSYALTSSYAILAQNVLGSITSASYALTASHAEFAKVATSASFATTASAATSLTFTASRTQLPPEIAYEDESNVFIVNQGISGSLNLSGSLNFTGDQNIQRSGTTKIALFNADIRFYDDLLFNVDNQESIGALGANRPRFVYISSASVIGADVGGFNQLRINGSVTASSYTGSFQGNGAQITGITSSSYAITSSFTTSASWAPNRVKAGSITAGSFTGNPKKATVTFTTAFPDTNYAAVVTGEDARTWVIESKVAGSFVINAGSNTALVGTTYWIATANGEI